MIHVCSECGAAFNDIFRLLDHERQHQIDRDNRDADQEAQAAARKAAKHARSFGNVYAAIALADDLGIITVGDDKVRELMKRLKFRMD